MNNRSRYMEEEKPMVTMEFAYKLAASLRDDNEILSKRLKECEKKVIILERQIKTINK